MDGFLGDFFSNFTSTPSYPGDANSFASPDLSNVVAPPPTLPDMSTFGGTSPTYGGGFDFTNSFGFTPISFSQPSVDTSGITQPNNLGGVAAQPLSTGSYSSPTSATSAGSDPLAALFSGGGQPNQQVGPTNFAAASAPGATPAPSGGGSSSLLDLIGLGTGSAKTDQGLLGAGVSGAGLLYNLLKGSPSASAEKQLKNIAGQQSAQGQQLESYVANGTLPPGAQQWVNQQTAAQQAAIRSKYAQLGMTGSTAEMQELNQVQQQATSQMFTIASQLLNTGVQETGASANLYQALMNAQNADAKDVSSAIQNFVTSLGGGGSPRSISLNLPSGA